MSTRPSRFLHARCQSGVTLVELLVSLALGLSVMVALASVYVAVKSSFRFQESAGRLQEDANYALEVISKELRMAGFAGCRGVDAATVNGVAAYYPTSIVSPVPTAITGPNPLATVEPGNALVTMQPMSPYNWLRGFDNVPSAMFASGSVPTSGNTDSLYFVSGSANALAISAPMATASSNLTIAADPYGWGTAYTYTLIVSDCNASSLFSGKLSGTTQIDHSIAIGNNANTFAANYLYGVDALVMPLQWHFFYVATRSGASTPSLYRISYDGNSRGTAQEVIANVERMKLYYGENLHGKDSVTASDCVLATGGATCVASMQADVWRTTAAAVTNWSNVMAVRVGLMLVGSENNTDVSSAPPTLLGAAYTPPAGASANRLRKEFSTTVVLRNRVAPR
jgi:type IV pilus assembly protein PilW